MSTITATTSLPQRQPISWANLLDEAVTVPGRIHTAYTAFYGYSLGNQLLALWQCGARGIDPGPIATYKVWQDKSRQVRKGERAIVLCQPVQVKGRRSEEDEEAQVQPDDGVVRTVFVYRPSWFVLSQTDGEAVEYPTVAEWDRAVALAELRITEILFRSTNGNVQGYAIPDQREIAVSPVAALPMKTTLHEMAHCILHAGEELAADGVDLPQSLKEVEAESVAYLVIESLGLEGAEYSRGYIQNWLHGNPIPEQNARRIFNAADRILKAGRSRAEMVAEIARLRAENAELAGVAR